MTWVFSLVAILCWGAWTVTEKMAVQYAPPVTVQVWSMTTFAAMVPFMVLLSRGAGVPLTWSGPGVAWSAFGALLSTVACISFLFAVQGAKVYLVTGITSTYPIVTLLISWWLLGEPVTWKSMLGTLSIVVGVALLQG